jgi:hypothetical protein
VGLRETLLSPSWHMSVHIDMRHRRNHHGAGEELGESRLVTTGTPRLAHDGELIARTTPSSMSANGSTAPSRFNPSSRPLQAITEIQKGLVHGT